MQREAVLRNADQRVGDAVAGDVGEHQAMRAVRDARAAIERAPQHLELGGIATDVEGDELGPAIAVEIRERGLYRHEERLACVDRRAVERAITVSEEHRVGAADVDGDQVEVPICVEVDDGERLRSAAQQAAGHGEATLPVVDAHLEPRGGGGHDVG